MKFHGCAVTREAVVLSRDDYDDFCATYGSDVLEWEGYPTLRAIRELRMVTWAAQVAVVRPEWRDEVQHRVDCLRGRKGPRPWQWTGIG